MHHTKITIMEPFKANYGTNTGIVTAPIQPAAEI